MRILQAVFVSLALTLPVAWAQTTFTNAGAITCAAGAGSNPGTTCLSYSSNITVSGMAGTISSLQVRLNNLTIDREQDLIAVLVGPTGSNLVLLSDAGSSFATNTSGVTLTLSDAAASSIGQTTTQAFTTGLFRPSGHNTGGATAKDDFPSPAPVQTSLTYPAPFGAASLASQFNGTNANGTWRLYVIDDALGPAVGNGGVSGINIAGGWSLIVTTAVANLPTSTTTTSSQNPSTTGNSVTFSATVTSGGNPVTLGSAIFFVDNVFAAGPLTLNGAGQASFATNSIPQGLSNVRADYSGATGFGSSSGSFTQEVINATVVNGNTFCNTGRIAIINDLNSPLSRPYPSKLSVSGLSGTINNMTLQLKGLTGGRGDDVELLLVGPNGAKFVVMNDVGGINAMSNLNIDLNDGAATLLPDDTALSSGLFRPTAVNSTAANFPAPAPAPSYSFAAPFGASTFAANFNGASPNGSWQLFLADDAGGGAPISLEAGYCIAFTTTSDPATTTSVSSSLNPSFTTAPNNSVTFTATVRRADNSNPVTSGTVTFTEGAAVLSGPTALNASGQASFTTTSLSEGLHAITATYNGSVGQFNSSNGSLNQTVDNHTVVSANRFCNPGPLTIPSSGLALQYPSRIFVSGLSGVVSGLTLSLNNMNGVRPDDLDLLLVGPTGARFVPLSDAGGNSDSVATTLTLDDAAASAIPDSGPLTSGAFRPSSYSPADTFPSPAPAGAHDEAAPAGAATFTSTFQGTDPNGAWQLFVNDDSLGGPGAFTNGYCLDFTMAADLQLSKSHSGNFTQGQTGAQYSLTVRNISGVNATGAISVTDTLPAGLTATAIAGDGWNCSLPSLTCSRNDGLVNGGILPVITLTVNVAANAPQLVTNSATVSGGGDLNLSNNTAEDNTTIVPTVAVTINTSPSGLSFSLDGVTYTAPQTFSLPAGSVHSLATSGTQGGPSTRYLFDNWSNGEAISHNLLVPPSAVSYQANFTTQHLLTTQVTPPGGGAITPGAFINAGTQVSLQATANSGFAFANFSGSLTGPANPQSLTMDAPKTVSANFVALTGLTVTTAPPGLAILFDGVQYVAPQTFNVAPGSNHTVATLTPQNSPNGTRYQFSAWSDGGAIAHVITAPASAATLTASFLTQYQLTTAVSPPGSGSIAPGSGQFFDAGSSVQVLAQPAPNFSFVNFTGDLTGSTTPQNIIMNGPASVTANFTSASVTAPNLTAQVTITRTTPVLNRTTRRFVQSVTVTNPGPAIAGAAFVLDGLPAGVALFQPAGATAAATPAGSPYKEIGAIGSGAAVTFTVEFTRTGTSAITYTPRLLGAGTR